MRYHFIAIGGAVMHQLALHLLDSGHEISGSDDAIFDPARQNLQKWGIMPEKFGWFPEKISTQLDAVILGMHAKADNPELLQAQALGVKVYSFPEFVYENARDKIRIVVAGSNGKTTTTSMIMHQMRSSGYDFDYLVGSKIEGFDYMVKVTNAAKYIVIEGDEYLTSPLDLRSKFLHYKPHHAIITSIDWDHINVFPTFDAYLDTFRKFISDVQENIFYYGEDATLTELIKGSETKAKKVAYKSLDYTTENTIPYITYNNNKYPSSVFGKHNFANWSAALHVCATVGIDAERFCENMGSFSGAARRMEKVYSSIEKDIHIFRDFAHAPAKLKATVKAARENYLVHRLVSVFELHTFSSMQEDFIPQYHNAMEGSDVAIVFMDENSFAQKGRQILDKEWIATHFGNPRPIICTHKEELEALLFSNIAPNSVFLLMSSGQLGGWDYIEFIQEVRTAI